MLDADGLVQMPRRHVAVGHALLNRLGPRPSLFERHQRHRCGRALVVARLTFGLEDRRDVFRERGRGKSGLRIADWGWWIGERGVALHRDLDLSVRPAAVIAEVAGRLAGAVVHDRLQDVLARLAEA